MACVRNTMRRRLRPFFTLQLVVWPAELSAERRRSDWLRAPQVRGIPTTTDRSAIEDGALLTMKV